MNEEQSLADTLDCLLAGLGDVLEQTNKELEKISSLEIVNDEGEVLLWNNETGT